MAGRWRCWLPPRPARVPVDCAGKLPSPTRWPPAATAIVCTVGNGSGDPLPQASLFYTAGPMPLSRGFAIAPPLMLTAFAWGAMPLLEALMQR